METELNESIVRRQHEELWSKGNLDIVSELYTPNCICHFMIGIEWRGWEGVQQTVALVRAGFPDWNEHVDDIISVGDRVVTRCTGQGTQKGDFLGVPPTGKQVTVTESTIFRMVDGKIAEQWGFSDLLHLLQQLGATVHPPEQGSR